MRQSAQYFHLTYFMVYMLGLEFLCLIRASSMLLVQIYCAQSPKVLIINKHSNTYSSRENGGLPHQLLLKATCPRWVSGYLYLSRRLRLLARLWYNQSPPIYIWPLSALLREIYEAEYVEDSIPPDVIKNQPMDLGLPHQTLGRLCNGKVSDFLTRSYKMRCSAEGVLSVVGFRSAPSSR